VTTLGDRPLLVNPPLVGEIAFTRQGRCQEREEVLGTTKPPYTLALVAALLRNRGSDVRLVDLTAERRSVDQLIAALDAERYAPTIVLFPSTIPTLAADSRAMAILKAHYDVPIVTFGPMASCAADEAMERAPEVDGMLAGEPEDDALGLAALESPAGFDQVPSLTFRQGGRIVPAREHGSFAGFLDAPYPAWDLIDVGRYRLPLLDAPYVLVETSRGCPYSCDFCVAPIHQGHKFRERGAASLVDEMEEGYRRFGLTCFYLWGDTVTLNVKSFAAFCDELIDRALPIRWLANARADNLTDPAFVARLRRAGCWMLALGIESGSEDTRKDMLKRLEEEKIRMALRNLRQAGIRSFAFFIFGYPGDTPATLDRTVDYAIELSPDFVNFYPAVPYPGTALYAKARDEGLLATTDWSRLEYSHYVLTGNGLDESTVLSAINRGKRRFYLRPGYLARHAGDLTRLAFTKWSIASEVAGRILFAGTPAPVDPGPATLTREPRVSSTDARR